MPGQSADENPDDSDHTKHREEDAGFCDQMYRFNGKTGNTVHRKPDHFVQWVVAFAGNALMALVIDAGALESDQRKHAPQEDVHFLKIRKVLQYPGRDKTVIRVIVYRLHPHPVHQLIE